MEKHLYAQMFTHESENWWFRGKRLVVHSLIDRFVPGYNSVLDIGCGTGATLNEFLLKGKKVFGTDVCEEAIHFSQKRGLQNIYKIDFSLEGFKDRQFDLILCLDVLEHITEDKKALT